MAKKTAKKSRASRIWRIARKIFLWLFIAQFVYIILLRWVNPPITITQVASWVGGHGLKRDYVRGSAISMHAKLAVIAAEDQLFPDHRGFDWKSIKKAIDHNKKSKRTRGASTISQQVAKNVFLWQGGGWFRKGLESYFTFMIETFWSKKRILEVYLNVSEMGEGIFGIEMAARSYFNKPARSLTRQEAALIAACLPNPKRYKVKSPSAYMLSKMRTILRQMDNLAPDPDIKKIIGIPIAAK